MIYYTQHTECEIRKRSDLTHFLKVKLIHTNPCFLFINSEAVSYQTNLRPENNRAGEILDFGDFPRKFVLGFNMI